MKIQCYHSQGYTNPGSQVPRTTVFGAMSGPSAWNLCHHFGAWNFEGASRFLVILYTPDHRGNHNSLVWDVTSYSVVGTYWRFGGIRLLHLPYLVEHMTSYGLGPPCHVGKAPPDRREIFGATSNLSL
jgi:hypothetical protein